MKPKLFHIVTVFAVFLANSLPAIACSVLFFFDERSGNSYIANNEDYFLDQEVTIRIFPSKRNQYARLWYGWDDFAQGGVNEHGLFFDGAVTPRESIPEGYAPPSGNLGDRILAKCQTVEDALNLLEFEKVALDNAHVMFGDASGNAVVVEWIDSERHLSFVSDGILVMTNFHLAGATGKEAQCYRYDSARSRIQKIIDSDQDMDLLVVGNAIGGAAQPARRSSEGRLTGTLYSTFIDLKEMKAVFVPKLDSSKAQKFDLRQEFQRTNGRRIKIQ